MRTEELIAELAVRATPVRALPSPGRRAVVWFALALAVASAGVWGFGARPDVMLRLQQPDFLGIVILALATSMLTVALTLVLAIPGAERTLLLRSAVIGVLALWAVTMAWAVVKSGSGLPFMTDSHWPACFARAVLLASVPALVLFGMARRALPLRPGWTAACAAAAAASIGVLSAQVACPLDDAGHAFLGHFVPVIVAAALGALARGTLRPSTS